MPAKSGRLNSISAMQRPQLEHIIRAASGITGATEIVVIGSQAVLGQFPDAPAALLVSIEADVFTFRDPADADLIDGSIGEGSPFHQTFGYYAHGVAEETAILPTGWKERLITLRNSNTGNGCGLCLEANDLAVAKLAAGREKDVVLLPNSYATNWPTRLRSKPACVRPLWSANAWNWRWPESNAWFRDKLRWHPCLPLRTSQFLSGFALGGYSSMSERSF